MKGLRIFERIVFDLPQQAKAETTPALVVQITVNGFFIPNPLIG